jgi:hypothetical protein
MFLVDTTTGRVWRYTRVTPSDSRVEEYIAAEIEIREIRIGRQFTDAEKRELRGEIAKTEKARLETLSNPCTGLVACFVEVDRIRLTPTGSWASEIVK